MAQIAGMMLNDSSQKFNFNIFDNEKMSVKDQLNYLKNLIALISKHLIMIAESS